MPQAKLNVDTLFCEAIAIDDAAARLAFIEQASDGNPELRQQLEKLVSAHFRAGEFLQQPVANVETAIYATDPECASIVAPSWEMGSTIGPYKIRELLGEGGMGSVYVAEQERPVRRKVALKVIKPGMDSRAVVARFEAERQALTLMDHPHIAKVLDAGTTDNGPPYFVMELVKGLPITEHCDAQQLGVQQRLELFIQVCRAVQHAHQKAVIHRDLKPSNILVAVHDTTPVVKVIDFGVAKALGSKLTDNTLYTGFNQLVGTPQYMSPEQAGQSSLDIDTRSDIYSLGVLLYELLTGSTPFDSSTLKQAGYDEMRRMIREVDPPRPSARISTLNAVHLSTIAEKRHMEARRLCRLLRGELDWIVMKALEKDRSRRYESVSGLQKDIERYLSNEPVLARPPSAAYQLKKFWQRRRGPVLTASVVVLALIATGVMAVTVAIRERQAVQRRLLVHQGIYDALGQVAGLRGQTGTADLVDPSALARSREYMQRALALAESGSVDPTVVSRVRELASELDQEQRDRRLLAALDEAWLADPSWNWDRRVASENSLPLLRDALTSAGFVVGQDDPRTTAAQIRRRHARVQTEIVGALYEWYSVLSPPVGITSTQEDSELGVAYVSPESPAGRSGLVEVGDRIVGIGQGTGGSPISTAGMTLPQFKHLLRGDPGTIVRLQVLPAGATQSRTVELPRDATAAWLWAVIQAADPDPWRQSVREACQLDDDTLRLAELHRLVDTADLGRQPVRFLNQLGAELLRAKAIDRATSFLKKVWQQYPADVGSNITLAICLQQREPPQKEEALRYYTTAVGLRPESRKIRNFRGFFFNKIGKHEEAIADFRAAIRLEPELVEAHYNLGNAQRDQLKLDEAKAAYREAIRIKPDYAEAHTNLGIVLFRQGKRDEAIAAYREAIRNKPFAEAYIAHTSLGSALMGLGKRDEAVAVFQEAIRLKPNNPVALNSLAWLLATATEPEWRDPAQSVALATQAVELAPTDGSCLNTKGVAQYRAGQWKAAVATLDKSVALLPQDQFAVNGFFLAMAHWQLGQQDEARQCYEQSVESMEKNDPADEELRRFRAEAAELLGIAEEQVPQRPE